MNKNSLMAAIVLMLLMGLGANAFAHCQVPCGIYGDKMRFDALSEHITTIKKSMNQIEKLSQEEAINYNQLVRWVNNKDQHANEIMDIALNYFLAQRIKPLTDMNDEAANEKYTAELEVMHRIIVHAMKAKQTIDLAHVDHLEKLVKKFYKLYFDEDMEDHLQEHAH